MSFICIKDLIQLKSGKKARKLSNQEESRSRRDNQNWLVKSHHGVTSWLGMCPDVWQRTSLFASYLCRIGSPARFLASPRRRMMR